MTEATPAIKTYNYCSICRKEVRGMPCSIKHGVFGNKDKCENEND